VSPANLVYARYIRRQSRASATNEALEDLATYQDFVGRGPDLNLGPSGYEPSPDRFEWWWLVVDMVLSWSFAIRSCWLVVADVTPCEMVY
jgi:hypothetical protein